MKIIQPPAKPSVAPDASAPKVANDPNEPLRPMQRQAAITKGLLTVNDYKQWAGRVRGTWKP